MAGDSDLRPEPDPFGFLTCSGDKVVTGQEPAGKHSWRAVLPHFSVHMNHPSISLKPRLQFIQPGWDGARESMLLIKSQVVLSSHSGSHLLRGKAGGRQVQGRKALFPT